MNPIKWLHGKIARWAITHDCPDPLKDWAYKWYREN